MAKKYAPKKGYYRPKNPEKYKGNPSTIIYRSGWELRYMQYLDEHPDVVQWASEELYIKYRCPVTKRVRRYFPDFVVKFKNREGLIETRIMEIKPHEQTKVPQRRSKYYEYRLKTAQINKAKWEAAIDYCKRRNIKFQLLTENELFGRKK